MSLRARSPAACGIQGEARGNPTQSVILSEAKNLLRSFGRCPQDDSFAVSSLASLGQGFVVSLLATTTFFWRTLSSYTKEDLLEDTCKPLFEIVNILERKLGLIHLKEFDEDFIWGRNHNILPESQIRNILL